MLPKVPVPVVPDGLKVPAVPAVPAVPDVSVPAPVAPALLPPLLVLAVVLALPVMLIGDPLCGSCARI